MQEVIDQRKSIIIKPSRRMNGGVNNASTENRSWRIASRDDRTDGRGVMRHATCHTIRGGRETNPKPDQAPLPSSPIPPTHLSLVLAGALMSRPVVSGVRAYTVFATYASGLIWFVWDTELAFRGWSGASGLSLRECATSFTQKETDHLSTTIEQIDVG